MILPRILLFLALPVTIHALGFADGVKIGEVTDSSVVLWTRLTEKAKADNRNDTWDPKNPHWTVPGQRGRVHFRIWPAADPKAITNTPWHQVDASSDFCHQATIKDLAPATSYGFVAEATASKSTSSTVTFRGSFTTAPAPEIEAPLTFVVSTGQDFPRRDDKAKGHIIYQSMLALDPAFFVETGDTLYYDKPNPFAKDIATARYKWNRIYALPHLREFHRQIPSYWMHDDHDLLKDDCWPGQEYGDLTWKQGLKVWREQIPQSAKPYRHFRWGKDLEVWFPEGREYRSPNPTPDGPNKTILGKKQWAWLEQSMKASDATFKLYISATPVVGPDRRAKNDNHANRGFQHEGQRLRKFLAGIPGCFVICGDRHWQYYSIDPTTGLHEFCSGPSSNQHAGGFSNKLRTPYQEFLRVKGGFLSVSITPKSATITHHDVHGKPVHQTNIPTPAPATPPRNQ